MFLRLGTGAGRGGLRATNIVDWNSPEANVFAKCWKGFEGEEAREWAAINPRRTQSTSPEQSGNPSRCWECYKAERDGGSQTLYSDQRELRTKGGSEVDVRLPALDAALRLLQAAAHTRWVIGRSGGGRGLGRRGEESGVTREGGEFEFSRSRQ